MSEKFKIIDNAGNPEIQAIHSKEVAEKLGLNTAELGKVLHDYILGNTNNPAELQKLLKKLNNTPDTAQLAEVLHQEISELPAHSKPRAVNVTETAKQNGHKEPSVLGFLVDKLLPRKAGTVNFHGGDSNS